VYDFTTSLGKIARLKVIVFIFDLLFSIGCALSFFSFLIGYNSGEIRTVLLLFTVAGFTAYLCSVHKVFARMFDKMLRFVRRCVKKLSKRLKNRKKS